MTGRLVLQAAGVTVVVFLSLTMYTFWAAKKGKDFNFLGPFLFAAIITLSIFSIIQVNTCMFCIRLLFQLLVIFLNNFLHPKLGYMHAILNNKLNI
jgi:FtsH-binding integral membrane protein